MHTALLAVTLAARVNGQTAGSLDVIAAGPGSSLTIRGSTTVGAKWHCSSTDIVSRVAVAARERSDSLRMPDVRGVTIHLPVSALRCQNGRMERAMRHALKADRDTAALAITGRFEIFDDLRPPTPTEVLLAGALRVAGVERNILLRSTVAPQSDASLHVRSAVAVTLSSFGITPPRVLWGAVRARDAITVEVDLRYPAPRRP